MKVKDTLSLRENWKKYDAKRGGGERDNKTFMTNSQNEWMDIDMTIQDRGVWKNVVANVMKQGTLR